MNVFDYRDERTGSLSAKSVLKKKVFDFNIKRPISVKKRSKSRTHANILH